MFKFPTHLLIGGPRENKGVIAKLRNH